MVAITESLSRLSKLGTTLNKETRSLIRLINNLESRLDKSAVSVPVWLGVVLHEQFSVEQDGDAEGEELVETRVVEGWDLGYCEIDGRWRIAVKRIKGRQDTVDYRGQKDYTWADLSAPVPLLDASRSVGLEAAGQLPALIEALGSRVEEVIQGIRGARRRTRK